MRRSMKHLFAGSAALLMLGSAGAAGNPTAATTALNLDACFDAQAARLPFSGVVVAAHGDREFFRAAGTMGPDGAAPRRDTPYRLASVTKVITAVAIGQLVDQGRIDLDAPVGTYLPSLPPPIASATIDQLLHHRSGVASLAGLTPEYVRAVSTARTASELVPLVANQPPAFAPGERQAYSNGGYILLGAVIEAVSGRSYDAHIRASLFDPLGMSDSGTEADARSAPPMTRLAGPGQPKMTVPRSLVAELPPRGTPAGSTVSSADDLLRLGRALLGDELLSAATKARIFPRRGEVWRIGQAGGGLGSNTDLAVLPDQGWVLVTLTNYDPPAGELMAEVLRGAVLGRGCNTLSEQDRLSRMRPPAP